MYPSMYQVMYVEKTFPTLISSKPRNRYIYFVEVGIRSTKLTTLENKRLCQAMDRRGAEIETTLNKSAFLPETREFSGIKD